MLIAEIGNNHFGDFNKAKELIKAAIDSGADLVKAQAFLPQDIKGGSMPRSFYKQCAFNGWRWLSLADYTQSLGGKLFFSIFSEELAFLKGVAGWHKLAAGQSEKCDYDMLEFLDTPKNILSFKTKPAYEFKNALTMAASGHFDEPDWSLIHALKGYSCHNVGINHCKAALALGAVTIEKHFTLEKDKSYNGITFRDTVHGSTPDEFEKLAKIF